MLPCVWCQHSSGNMFTIHTVLQDGVSVFAVCSDRILWILLL